MPKVLAEYAELRRQQIIDSAIACFVEKGIRRTTIKDICQRAELSPAALYRYFHGKDEIISAAIVGSRNADAERIREAMAARDTSGAFEELIEALLGSVDSKPLRIFTIELIAESIRGDGAADALRSGQERTLVPLVEFVRRAQANGELDARLDCVGVARVLLSMYWGLVVQKLIEPTMDLKTYVEAARSLFGGRAWSGPAWAIPGLPFHSVQPESLVEERPQR